MALYPGRILARELCLAKKVEFLPREVDSFGMYVGFSKKSKCNSLKGRFADSLRKEVEAGRFASLLEAARRETDGSLADEQKKANIKTNKSGQTTIVDSAAEEKTRSLPYLP